MTFADLRLAEPLLRAVAAEGYTIPTPIQVQAIPHVLAGRDLFGCAQTGTGKTAAFALPIIQRLSQAAPRQPRPIRALVLSPTRELAAQIGESFRTYGQHAGLRQTVIFGGVGQGNQVRALREGVDILVATPGRLIDLMEQGFVNLKSVEVFVLDEGDRMLDMGFIHAIRRIAPHLPAKRQTLLFSATMPAEIRELAGKLMRDPVETRVAPVSAAADNVEQFVYFVARNDKPTLLRQLLKANGMSRTLVFTRTKHGADRVVKQLRMWGIRADAIHGNKKQSARERALLSFKSQDPPVLVATDIASRGIDIDEISHVINYEIPVEPETYVHRIGRTARAGASGTALSFCDAEERPRIKAIEKLIRQPITVRAEKLVTSQSPEVIAQARVVVHRQHQQPAPRQASPQTSRNKPQRREMAGIGAGATEYRAGQPARQGGHAGWPKRRHQTAGKTKHRRF